MNKSLKEQLAEVFVKQIDKVYHRRDGIYDELDPILKRTDFDFNASNAANPHKGALKNDDGLKRK